MNKRHRRIVLDTETVAELRASHTGVAFILVWEGPRTGMYAVVETGHALPRDSCEGTGDVSQTHDETHANRKEQSSRATNTKAEKQKKRDEIKAHMDTLRHTLVSKCRSLMFVPIN